MHRRIVITSAIAFFLVGLVTIFAVFAMRGEMVDDASNARKRDEPIVSIGSLRLLSAVGDVIPNTWSIIFQDNAPMDLIIDQIVSRTSCTIRDSYADVKILSVTCPTLSLTSLVTLGIVLRYGVSYEPELRWTSEQTQSNAPWGLDRTDQRNLPLSGTYTTGGIDGTGVDVHVLDTGVYAAHTNFGGRVRAGYDAIGDGAATTTDCQGHGTHVAGTIGGSTFGIAKNVQIYASRVLGCDGRGSTSGIISAIRWAVAMSTSRRKVINMSLGGAGTSTSLDQAVADATSRGVVVVVAAGNENQDACNVSPARAPSAITVMASDRSDVRGSFSNYGSCADIIAPGVNIVSASHQSTTGAAGMSGTSMAAPHVAGVAALVLQAFPSYTPAQVANHIISTSTTGKFSNLPANSPNRLLFWSRP
eukprot:TRINITY_DN19956_c0_g1_i1.p1 TRINITY_DN19956_c0_g1~~TRINITY_DN19956_c0_g1_i1.p1  ORF type:complete len:418 (+),score=95.06 TRINITY_DN19956_c0_g1_i1:16-1269(+)